MDSLTYVLHGVHINRCSECSIHLQMFHLEYTLTGVHMEYTLTEGQHWGYSYKRSTGSIHLHMFHMVYSLTDAPHGVYTCRCFTLNIYLHMFHIEYSLKHVRNWACTYRCSTWKLNNGLQMLFGEFQLSDVTHSIWIYTSICNILKNIIHGVFIYRCSTWNIR